ncbi:hypothetical protein [Amycolatopsis sp. cmx-4-61]|uniref:hypothetical protein n=1 Tax=Amycolatopsis sp. cmx-4-61 TaxID=2790937 RepID=UPI00397DE6C1
MFLERLGAFVAPVADNQGAVIQDPALLAFAQAVYKVFGDLDETGEGLTIEQIEAGCPATDPRIFDSRIALFKQLKLLRRPHGHAYQRRLLFNTTSVAGLLVFDKLRRGTGIQEILFLLDETRRDIQAGLITREEVSERLTTLRRALSISAGELVQLRDRPVEELIRERRNHRAADRLLTEAKELVHVVERRFSELSSAGAKLITQALRYSGAANDLVDRLLRAVTAERDFSMLLPEQYRTAALQSAQDALAAVFANMAFDPPAASITPDEILATVEQYRPRGPTRRAPRSPDLPADHDPLRRAREQRARQQERREASLRLQMAGHSEMDLTAHIESLAWPEAARFVAEVLAASGDPDVPFTVLLPDELRVNADGSVSYVTPMQLIDEGRRTR